MLNDILPRFLARMSRKAMFPVSWHQAFNYMWFAQSVIALVYCLFTKRFLPTTNDSKNSNTSANGYFTLLSPSKGTSPFSTSFSTSTTSNGYGKKRNQKPSLFLNQFKVLLISHTLFYFVELCLTSMWTKFTSMAWHHVAACAIFILFFLEPPAFCFIAFLPFTIHGYFWILGAEDMNLLTLYNWTFFLVGLGSLWFAASTGAKVISYRLPLLSVSVVAINTFTYCREYGGYYCPRMGYFWTHFDEIKVLILLGYSAVCFVIHWIGLKRWKKMNSYENVKLA